MRSGSNFASNFASRSPTSRAQELPTLRTLQVYADFTKRKSLERVQ
jgi:hypothetical protein